MQQDVEVLEEANVTPISQVDNRWKHLKIGNTGLTIARWGCYICSTCMAVEKLRGSFCNPGDASKNWVFDKNGLFIPSKSKIKGAEYRGSWNTLSRHRIFYYANEPDFALILKVSSPTIPQHFVFVKSYNWGEYTIIDPIDGKTKNLKNTKYKIIGYRVFEAIPNP